MQDLRGHAGQVVGFILQLCKNVSFSLTHYIHHCMVDMSAEVREGDGHAFGVWVLLGRYGVSADAGRGVLKEGLKRLRILRYGEDTGRVAVGTDSHRDDRDAIAVGDMPVFKREVITFGGVI